MLLLWLHCEWVYLGGFSNESGLGSAPIAHAAAETNSPVRQGTIAMLGTFIDTLIICTMTGLVLIVSGVWSSELEGAAMTLQVFDSSLPLAAIYYLYVLPYLPLPPCLAGVTTVNAALSFTWSKGGYTI